MPNGLTVMLLEDQELPMIGGALYVRGGSLWETPHDQGLTSALGPLMRSGGAGTLDADALDRRLEELSAQVSSAFGDEFGTISFGCLNSDVDEVFSLFADVALRPRFDRQRLALWKGQSLEGIRRRADDPDTVAGISFGQLLYRDHPLGRVLGERDVLRIGREQLRAAHQHYIRPDGAILAIAGAIDRPHVEALAAKFFGEWQPRGSSLSSPPGVADQPSPGIYFIELPFEQATVRIGELGPRRLSPDAIPIEVFNRVFGNGGFGSELMERIRTQLGLAYVVYGGVSPGAVEGMNIIGLQTKGESTGRAIEESIKILKEMQHVPVAADDLDETKTTLSNSFIFRFDSTGDLIRRYALLELLGYPADYDMTYLSKVAQVSAGDVTEVAQQRWHPERLVYVIVGNHTAYEALAASRADSGSVLHGIPLFRARFTDRLEVIGPASGIPAAN